MNETTPFGATWPDVALAVVEFARHDSWKFIVVFVAMVFVMWLVYSLLPSKIVEYYKLLRNKRHGKHSGNGGGSG